MPTESGQTTIIVAEDHPLYREALIAAIARRSDLELIGSAADGHETLVRTRELIPDVLVLDMRMPRGEGVSLIRALVSAELPTRVVLLSAHVDSDVVYEGIAAGAAGFLSKSMGADEICDAIAAVARGKTVLAPEVQGGLVAGVRQHAPQDQPDLTKREHEILELVAAGRSAPEIGRELHLSTGTVKTHLQHIYEKFGISDRGAVVAEAMRRGLIE